MDTRFTGEELAFQYHLNEVFFEDVRVPVNNRRGSGR